MPYADRETYLEYQRAYGRANRDRLREYFRSWNERNMDKVRANRSRWYWANREKAIRLTVVKNANRRAAVGRASLEQVTARVLYFGEKCYICGGDWEAMDHVIPLARGGTGWPANLRPICQSCNSRKGTRDWRTFCR